MARLRHRRKHFRGGGVSYLVEEDFEGTGLPSGWTNNSLTVDWDDTTQTSPQGGENAKVIGFTSNQVVIPVASTARYCYFQFYIDAITPFNSASARSPVAFRSSGGAVLAIFRLRQGGGVSVYANGSDSALTATNMSGSTWYHCWLRWTPSGTCSVGFSTNGVEPTSGNQFVSKTGGSGTVARITLNDITSSQNHHLDRFIVSESTIGDNP